MTTTNDDPSKYGPFDYGDKENTLTLAAKITANEKARAWFTHGLAWMYGYNHEEAIACFTKATAADENCAMAWWGIAYSVSSSYNWSPGLGCGYDAITAAKGIVEKGATLTDLEKDLISALSARSTKEARDNADPTKLNFGNGPELNQAFADEMAKVYDKYPTDNDVAAVYAEALMNLNAWALWDRTVDDTGTVAVKPHDDNTLTIQKVIEAAFENPKGKEHPALTHLYCHLMELSANPEKALPAANYLRTAMPGMGHLVHMPSHIDAWVGGYKEGVKCNEDGTAADDLYVSTTGNESQFYKFYRMHNMHFTVWMSMHDGRYENAMKYARKMQDQLTKEQVTFMLAGIIPMGAVFLEAFNTMPWHVWIRFGKWAEILAEPIPEDASVFPATIATAHYARAMAHAVQGNIEEATKSKEAFLKARLEPALNGRVLHNNAMYSEDGPCIFNVAEAVLEGELLYRKAVLADGSPDTYDAAFNKLREAVKLSENLKYDEPWGWMVPVRHALGALLLEQGRIEEATAVYRADVTLWKDNMWGLHGLVSCLKAAKKPFAEEEAKYKIATERSDIKLQATCFCAAAAGAKVKN